MTQKQRKQEGEKIRILFISIKNNTRIQIAERFLKHSAPFVFEVFSEGTLPVLELNFFAVQVTSEQEKTP